MAPGKTETSTIALWPHSHVASIERMPFSRMFSSVTGCSGSKAWGCWRRARRALELTDPEILTTIFVVDEVGAEKISII